MKKIIRFHTDNEVAFKYFKPEPVKRVIPEWYIKMHMTHPDVWKSAKQFAEMGLTAGHIVSAGMTAKACMPMRDYMVSGYLIRSYADVAFTVEEREGQEAFTFVTPESSQIEMHHNWQLPSIGDGKTRDYIKFNNPWVIETDPGYSCLFYPPEYLFEDRFRLLPSIVDTDRYDAPVKFPGMFTKRGDFVVKAGTPLMCVFPYKRDEFESQVTFGKFSKPLVANLLKNAYKNFFRVKKVYE